MPRSTIQSTVSLEKLDGVQREQRAGELDRQAKTQLNRGNSDEAFRLYEKNLQYFMQFFGLDSKEFIKYFDETMHTICETALGFIREGRIEDAYRILKKAEGFCVVGRYSPDVKYRVTVLNHLGCCMRRFGKNKIALGYLAAALKISRNFMNSELLATTCLNLCAVYRQLEDHAKVK